MTLNPVSIAIAGAGRMGELYARIIEQHPLARLTALSCRSEETANRLRKSFDVPVIASEDPAALSEAGGRPDALVIATPEWAHLEPVRWAASLGLATLLEKPMAGDLEGAEAIAREAASLGDRFMLCHVVRFDPRYAAMRNSVKSGAVGKVRQMYARRNADQVAAARILGKCDPAFWLTPHDIDIMRWTTGAEVSWVDARYAGSGSDASDGLFVDLGFTDGSVGRIENAWITPQMYNSRNCLFDLLGEEGAIEVDAWQQGIVLRGRDDRATAPNTAEICEVDGRITGAFANMIDAFVNVAAGRRASPVTLADGLASMRAADAISRSLASDGKIRL